MNVCVNKDNVSNQNKTFVNKELEIEVVREYWLHWIRRKYADNLKEVINIHLESWRSPSLTWVDQFMIFSDILLAPYGYVEESDHICHGFSQYKTLAYRMENTRSSSSWDVTCRYIRLKYLDLHIPGTLRTFCHSCYPLLRNGTTITNICYHPGDPLSFYDESEEENENEEENESEEERK